MAAHSFVPNFRKELWRALLLPTGAIGLAALLLGLGVYNLLVVVAKSGHSVEIISSAHEAERLLIDLETGLRGYRLTHDARFLQPYDAALPMIFPRLDELERLVSNNSEQVAQVTRIRRDVQSWLEFARVAHDDLLHPESELTGKERMDQARADIDTFRRVENALLKDGLMAVSTAKRSTLLSGAVVTAILGLFIAFWVRRQMTQLDGSYQSIAADLSEREEWFRVTLMSIGDAVLVTDREGQVVFINAEAERLTGWDRARALHQPLQTIFRIVHEDTRAKVDDPVEKVFREKQAVGLANHTLLLAKDGAEWPIEDSAAPVFDSKGQIIGVVLVFHDATETRRAQSTLKTYSEDLERKVQERTAQLQRTIDDLEAFSYTISHDLRSPLRAMQGYAQCLQEDFEGKLDPAALEYVSRISAAAERLDVLIQAILMYSRQGAESLALSVVNLDRLVGDIVHQYPAFYNIESSIQIERPLHPVMAHEPGLTQVVANFLTNALRFQSPDRPLKIRIRTEVSEGSVRLWVEDNGIGIHAKDHERIFKMFEQVAPTSRGGTGIGLAIVRRAAEKMQGSVGVMAQPGIGSRFWIELLKPSSKR